MRAGGDGRVPAIVAVGFGVTVAMWGIGYVGRLPGLLLPGPVLLPLFLGCLFAGGLILARRAGFGWASGAAAGLVSGLLNLLVLGGFLSGERPNELVPSALLWVPGSVLVACLLAAVGAGAGRRWLPRSRRHTDWAAVFAGVAVGAAALLLAVGGLVTSTGAGLAVVDWPNTFEYNLFLYPFSRMTGGIYYEHAHRLFGALVGLTTLALAIVTQRMDRRRWARGLGWVAFAMVVVQGLLGGLRVTGTLTLSSSPEAMRPSLTLALAHGVLGQLFFATLAALAAVQSATWKGAAAPRVRAGARADRLLAVSLVGAMLVQLVLGAAQRHFSQLLLAHVLVGLAVVAPLAMHAGFRAWSLNEGQPLLERLGLLLVAAVGIQIGLGLFAWAAGAGLAGETLPPWTEVGFATAHQWFGAVLLAVAVSLACWTFRLLSPRA